MLMVSNDLRYTRIQLELLNRLLDKWERGPVSHEGGTGRRMPRVKPAEIWPDYDKPFTDVGEIADFEREADVLAAQGIADVVRKDGTIRFLRIMEDQIPRVYGITGREPKQSRLLREKQMYESFLGNGSISDAFCHEQIERLDAGKNAAYTAGRGERICKLLNIIEGNESELPERELSVRALGDSKAFETSYRKTVCKLIEMYGLKDHPERIALITDPRAREAVLLEEYGVVANPVYVNVKGNLTLQCTDGTQLDLREGTPVAVSASMINQISCIGNVRAVMTVENLTTFHSMDENGHLVLYAGGYHNRSLQKLLQKLRACCPEAAFFHFGDIDPDGFMILEHLKEKTGLKILPYRMGIAELDMYRNSCRKLAPQDVKKAKSLLDREQYTDVIRYMMENDIKLEQEAIISRQYSASAAHTAYPRIPA